MVLGEQRLGRLKHDGAGIGRGGGDPIGEDLRLFVGIGVGGAGAGAAPVAGRPRPGTGRSRSRCPADSAGHGFRKSRSGRRRRRRVACRRRSRSFPTPPSVPRDTGTNEPSGLARRRRTPCRCLPARLPCSSRRGPSTVGRGIGEYRQVDAAARRFRIGRHERERVAHLPVDVVSPSSSGTRARDVEKNRGLRWPRHPRRQRCGRGWRWRFRGVGSGPISLVTPLARS